MSEQKIGLNTYYPYRSYSDSLSGYHRPVAQSVMQDQFIGRTHARQVDASNDGNFSLGQALKNFGKGLISPITSMFESTTNFLLGAGMLVAGGALVIGTGGAAAPLLMALGLGIGAVQTGSALYNMATAKNGDDLEKAFYDAGAATGTIGMSVLGAKASLKGAGSATKLSMAEIEGMSTLQATIQNIKAVPSSISKSFQVIRSGKAWANVTGLFGVKAVKSANTTQAKPVQTDVAKPIAPLNSPAGAMGPEPVTTKPMVVDSVEPSFPAIAAPEKVSVSSAVESAEQPKPVADGADAVQTSISDGDAVSSKPIESADVRPAIVPEKPLDFHTAVSQADDGHVRGTRLGEIGFVDSKNNSYNAVVSYEETPLGEKIYRLYANNREQGQHYNFKHESTPRRFHSDLPSGYDDLILNAVTKSKRRVSVVEGESLIPKTLIETKNAEILEQIAQAKIARAEYVQVNRVGKTHLVNKSTGESVEAIVTHQTTRNGSKISLYAEQDGDFCQLGVMDMKKSEGYLGACKKHSQNVLEVDVLSSMAGDKYKGIGSQLMQAAVETSINEGYEGRVILNACNDTPYYSYRNNGDSPVPFYRKAGFSTGVDALDTRIDAGIIALKNGQAYEGPQTAIMYLPDEQITIYKNRIAQANVKV